MCGGNTDGNASNDLNTEESKGDHGSEEETKGDHTGEETFTESEPSAVAVCAS